MLYIFLVNTGTMMTLDMNLALDTVENLKLSIYEKYQIPVSNQVLLISGGESLNLNDRVCNFSSAGTDTSPIFLFIKTQLELQLPIFSLSDTNLGEDMKDRVQSCLEMEPNFNTVISRTEMAMQLYETDNNLFHTCDKLVHDQHLQQQGWAAVVANLEDIVLSFKNKAEKVELLYNHILQNKSYFYELLKSFEQDKQILSKIPILKCLLPKNEKHNYQTLLDWILREDSQNSLDVLFCLDELESFTEDNLEELKMEIKTNLQNCESSDMKEIKGLTEYLFRLEELMVENKKYYEKQGILTHGFTKNQSRISDIRDTSILPDLCRNHSEQLKNMLDIHNRLMENKKRCFIAKKELSRSLNSRLNWIVYVEEKLKQNDEILVIHGIKLQKLRNKLEIIQNLNLAPQVYLKSIVEVLRRKTFSEHFYNWFQTVSEMARKIINNEIELRESFSAHLGNHFLKLFFPGMSDYPKNFILEIPEIDTELPPITPEDIEYLKSKIPEMSNNLVVPSSVPIPLLSLNESCINERTNESIDSDSLNPQFKETFMSTSLNMADISLLETVKFDLEKLLKDKNIYIEELVEKLSITENNFQTQNAIVDKYSILNNLLKDFFAFLNNNFSKTMRAEIENYNRCIQVSLQELNKNFLQIQSQLNIKSTEMKQVLSNHDLNNQNLQEKIKLLEDKLESQNCELTNLQSKINEKEQIIKKQAEEIVSLKGQIDQQEQFIDINNSIMSDINNGINNLQSRWKINQSEIRQILDDFKLKEFKPIEQMFCQELSQIMEKSQTIIKQIEERMVSEKEDQIQKLREQLSLEHKSEIDLLRHRFKLAISTTSIERTSSETSLEKVQLDIVDQSIQEKEIQKLKNQMIEQKTDSENQIAKLKSDFNKLIQEKDKKLMLWENLRKFFKDSELSPDNVAQRLSTYDSLFTRISSYFNVDIDSCDLAQCKEIFNVLNHELLDFNQGVDLSNYLSFISIPTSPESSNPGTSIDSISTLKSYEYFIQNSDYKVSLTSCEIGNNIFVYYEKDFDNFLVLTLNDHLHYIHPDSIKECDFSKEFQSIVAKVIEKEYCQVKKQTNRFKLPLNTKFYRVKIKKLIKCNSGPGKLKQLRGMNHSYISSSSSQSLVSNILSPDPTQMSRSYSFEPN